MMEDLTFLALAAREDRARQEKVVERLAPEIHRLAVRYAGGDADLEEELLHIGRLAVLEAIRRFDPNREVCFHTYALRCVRNALLYFLRGRRRWQQHCVSLSDETVVAEVDAQSAAAWSIQDSLLPPKCAAELTREDLQDEALRQVVQGLSEEEWRLVCWREAEGESYADIAARLAKSVDAVKQAHYRAKKKITAAREQMFARGR
jgi:RNA polymerase sigma factor (sigma-70 family)